MVDGKKRYSVYLGTFSNKDQAQIQLDEINKADIKDVKDPYITKLDSEEANKSGS